MVTVTSSPPPPHTEGSKVTLFCSTQLPPYVDTGVTVSAKWMHSGVNLSNVGAPTQLINGSHHSEFVIERLNSATAGEYTCSITVSGNTQFILGATVSNTTMITLNTGMLLFNCFNIECCTDHFSLFFFVVSFLMLAFSTVTPPTTKPTSGR